MIDSQKISIGKVRRAYALNDHDLNNLMAALWPQDIFPWELWQRIHEKLWRSFTDRNKTLYHIESPTFPENNATGEGFLSLYIYSFEIVDILMRLASSVHVEAIRLGLKDLLEVAYENSSDVQVQGEIDSLLKKLTEIEKNSPYQFYMVSFDGFLSLMEKKQNIHSTQYQFLSRLYPDTILVDKTAAIRYLDSINFPLQQEVKGITRNLVESIIKAASEENIPAPRIEKQTVEGTAEGLPQEQGNSITVPASLWEGKPFAAVRNAMKEDFGNPVIAYVLLKWCKATKTEAGRLLSKKQYNDEKSYRNLIDDLMKKAASMTIIKG